MLKRIWQKSETAMRIPVRVKTFHSPPSAGSESYNNEYLIYDKGEAVTIDVDTSIDDVLGHLQQEGLTLKWILATHGHLSHVRAVSRLKAETGAAFGIHLWDSELFAEDLPDLGIDRSLKDNETLPVGRATIKVLHTPGHTKGSLCYWLRSAEAIFTGNTLLKGGNGRIWGPKSMSLMLFSLKRLNYSLPMATAVYPGEGEPTTLKKDYRMVCLRSA